MNWFTSPPTDTGFTIPYNGKTWRFVDKMGEKNKDGRYVTIILNNIDKTDTKDVSIILHRPENFDDLDDKGKYNKIIYLLQPHTGKGGRKSRGRKSRRRKPTRRRRR
jgi:hypothetical protein